MRTVYWVMKLYVKLHTSAAANDRRMSLECLVWRSHRLLHGLINCMEHHAENAAACLLKKTQCTHNTSQLRSFLLKLRK
jgi:hypothetical protein